jgi:N-acetylmuramoyl-L-alanine amidase
VKTRRSAIAATATACVVALITVTSAAAATVAPSAASRPHVARLVAVVPRVTHVTLQVTAGDVKPHDLTALTATVIPRVAGRSVTLKEVVGGGFRGLARAFTVRGGTAVLHVTFPRQGSLHLRVFVASTPRYQAAISPRVVEVVTETLPIVLPAGVQLGLGATGANVLAVQQRLAGLGYWLGTPDGTFGDSTQQAVYALQKAAGIGRTGTVGSPTIAAINKGAVPAPRTTSGNAIDVDLERDLVMIVHGGKLFAVLNTSTGGGYTYVQQGVTNVATTPTGVFQFQRATDGLVVDSLGALWRPRFFYEGFAIHGDSYVPPFPVSHGCVRVSNEAIDWIWAQNLAPIGSEVWVY